MADVIEFTDQVVRVGSGTSTQPLAQAQDVADYAQLDLLLGVHEVGSGSPGPTVEVLTADDARQEDGWVVAGAFAAATGANQWQRLSVRNLLRWARLRVSTGTSSATVSVRGMARRRRAGFQPTQLAGLLGWYTADCGLKLTPDKVAAWTDQSGQNNDLVQSTSWLQPTYRAASDVGQRPGLEFKAGQSLELASLTLGPFTIAAVARATTPAGIVYEHSIDAGSHPGSYLYGSVGATVVVHRGTLLTARDATTDWEVDGAAHALVHRYDGTHLGNQLWIDGRARSLVDYSPFTTSDPGTTPTTQPFYLGSRASSSVFFSGTMREVVIYDRALSDIELKTLSEYLRRNAGLE